MPSLEDGAPHQRVAAAAEEAALALWRRRPFVIATVAAIGTTLAFPAFVALALGWASRLAADVGSRERVRVFLAESAGAGEIEAVRSALLASPGVESAELIEREAARAAFLARFPDLAGVVEELGPDGLSLPRTVEAGGRAAPVVLEAAARRVAQLPGVEEVRYDARAAERLAGAAARLDVAAAVVALVALAAAGFGIGNVIWVGALARREQLAILRLVGAPRFHALAPFVLEGAVQGAIGGLVAWGLCEGALRAAAAPLAALLPASAEGVPARAALLLVAGPALAGGLAAWLAAASVLARQARLER